MVMGVIYKLSYIMMCDKSQKLLHETRKVFPLLALFLVKGKDGHKL